MASNPENPCLRYLEALPHTQDGKPLVVLRDPLQVSDRILVVSPQVCQILALMDGSHSVREIQLVLTRQAGELIYSEQIQHLVDQLDQAWFLDNENFRQRYRELLEEFRSAPVRRAAHAGTSYPAQPGPLQEAISAFYTDQRGAGVPGERSGRRLKGMAAPHIDLRLGGPTYTHAYRALAESEPPDTFIILGTAHSGLPELFSVSRKDFETPLGVASVDRDLLRLLDERLGKDEFAEDLTHRNEHTVEFQIPFLQHLFSRGGFQILPVLCSFSYQQLRGQDTSGEDRRFDRFVSGLRKALAQSGKRACFVSSIDLAHIGPRYGDQERPEQELVQRVLRRDQQMLEPVLQGDPTGFFDFVAEERDQRRICGFSPLYTMLHLLEGQEGSLLAHEHSQMDPSGSFVSYASLIF